MILMWLGSFVLLMWGLTSFQKHVGAFFANFQKSILDKGLSESMASLFAQTWMVTATEASPQKSLYSALGFLNLRILATRPAVLMMCLSPLAAIPVFILSSTFLAFSGFFILGVCVLMWLKFWKSKRVDSFFQILFSVGIFLIGAESLLRNSRVVQTYLAESDWAFFLADGRFGAVLAVVLLSFILSIFVQVEFWSLALALSLLTTGTVSFNGALGILLGERLATAAVFWFRTRNLNQECRKLGKQYSIIMVLSSILGFWVAGETRVFLDIGFSADLNAVQDKTLSLLMLFAIMLAAQFIAGMIWGHFAGTANTDELQDPLYFSPNWLDRDLLAEGPRSWAKDRVHKRLGEIRYHLAGLHSVKAGQVPEHIQKRIKEEERQLALLHL